MNSYAPATPRCKRCGQEVRFEKTRNNKWQMLNPVPSYTEGNIVLIGFGEAARTYVYSEAELNDGQQHIRFTDHHATCRVLARERQHDRLRRRGVVIFPPRPNSFSSGVPR